MCIYTIYIHICIYIILKWNTGICTELMRGVGFGENEKDMELKWQEDQPDRFKGISYICNGFIFKLKLRGKVVSKY